MCAHGLGIDVGLVGHEYKLVEEDEGKQCISLAVDDSDEDDVATVSKRNMKRIRRTIIDTPESNNDSE